MPPKYSCLLRHSVTQRNEMNLFYNPQTSSTPSPEPTKGLSGLKLCPCPITLSIYKQLNHITSSGAETNLKVGGTCHAPPLILTLQIKLVVLVSAFVMASTVWSVSCFLFFYSLCPLPRAQPFVKVWGGGHVPPSCHMESAPLITKADICWQITVPEEVAYGSPIHASLAGKST